MYLSYLYFTDGLDYVNSSQLVFFPKLILNFGRTESTMWKIRSDLLVRRSPFRFRGKFLLQGLCFIPDFRRSFFLNILPNHLVFQVGLLLSRFLILLYNAHNQVRRRIFLSFALILFLGSFWVIFSGFIRYSASISTVYKNFRCNTNDEFCTSILKATLKIISTFSCRASFA